MADPCNPTPAPPTDLAAEIARTAADPQSVTVDGETVAAQPLPDLIKADQYLAAKKSLAGSAARGGSRSLWNALRPAQAVPPGAV